MNLRRLRHFETLYRIGNFARAADELGLTQSALTRSIQKLEGELDAPLFDRSTHYVRPTGAAERLIRSARDVIAAAANLEQEARGLKQPTTGTVRIGAGPYPLQPLLTDAIIRFARDHPAVRVTVTGGPSEQLLETLVDRRLDLVVCDRAKFATSGHADEVLCIPLPSEPLVVVCRADHPCWPPKDAPTRRRGAGPCPARHRAATFRVPCARASPPACSPITSWIPPPPASTWRAAPRHHRRAAIAGGARLRRRHARHATAAGGRTDARRHPPVAQPQPQRAGIGLRDHPAGTA
jgi:DNA-binding transcriptional LysR family regulator